MPGRYRNQRSGADTSRMQSGLLITIGRRRQAFRGVEVEGYRGLNCGAQFGVTKWIAQSLAVA